MTTEKKTVSKVTNKVAVKSEAGSKLSRQPSVRRTTVTKAPVKRTAAKTIPTIGNIEPIKTTIVKQSESENKVKSTKMKMVRDSFTIPREEYAQLGLLKVRLAELGQPAKKSELLRAGIKLLVSMTDTKLKATMTTVPVIKTGRPKKKK